VSVTELKTEPVAKEESMGYVSISLNASGETLRGTLDKLKEVASEATQTAKDTGEVIPELPKEVIDLMTATEKHLEELDKFQVEKDEDAPSPAGAIDAVAKNVGSRVILN
jgi:hypothetical protein